MIYGICDSLFCLAKIGKFLGKTHSGVLAKQLLESNQLFSLSKEINTFTSSYFFFLIKGTVLVEIGSKTYLVKEHELVIIPSGQMFSIKYFENAEGYIGALSKSYSDAGRYFCESVEMSKYGLTPASAGALVQARAFATVYQEIISKIASGVELPAVLDSVLQPHVEVYKKNLKPQADGKDVVVAGRIS